MFNFKITHKPKQGQYRLGEIETPHGKIQTPIFMPVGTKATVKTLSRQDLEAIGAEIILGNTYHLYLRPGDDLIKQMGQLHKWMNWPHPILTDSGGFQVFSLGENKQNRQKSPNEVKTKIYEDGVKFKSHLDGSYHYLTPQKSIEIQHHLGSDIVMAFDECAPADSSKEYFIKAMKRTHDWLKISKETHDHLNEQQEIKQTLFGIVQGGVFEDLRIESAKFVNQLGTPGIAIGGLAVGETKDKMHQMIEAVIPHLDESKPRYLMGVGTPEDLLECIERGIDMFDCVHPSRMARHGSFWNSQGRHNIQNEKFKFDSTPLDINCQAECCKFHSKSYIRHLLNENEILGLKLMTVHNLNFLLTLIRQIRVAIKEERFPEFKKDFLTEFHREKQTNPTQIFDQKL